MGLGLWMYRASTSLAEAALGGLLAKIGPRGGTWRAGFERGGRDVEWIAGSVWIHAASMGEVGAARAWTEALLGAGYRAPILLSTRTRAGLERARADLGDRVVVRIAPHDFPRCVRSVLDTACPWRLDLIETELWPNLIVEARRRSVAVILVGATVSDRTAGRLRALGIAGPDFLGEGVYALPQTETHAARLETLGVPKARIRVIGDLKADRPGPDHLPPFHSRPALVFGSLRPGEEGVARLLARALEAHRARFGAPRAEWAAGRAEADEFEGRSRAVLVIAPRHPEGVARVRAAFRWSGFEVHERTASDPARAPVADWIEELSRRSGPRVGLLATRGELTSAYEGAWGAVVGGTFVSRGGHNVWEPAVRGCPVIVGPSHGEVAAAVEAIVREGGGVVASGGGHHLRRILDGWLMDRDLERRGASAARAVAKGSGAAGRALAALDAWGLTP